MEEIRSYAVVNDILAPRIVVDIDCHTPQCGDFGGELIEARAVLSVRGLAVVTANVCGMIILTIPWCMPPPSSLGIKAARVVRRFSFTGSLGSLVAAIRRAEFKVMTARILP